MVLKTFLVYFVFFFFQTGSHSVAHIGLIEGNPPVSASLLLWLHLSATCLHLETFTNTSNQSTMILWKKPDNKHKGSESNRSLWLLHSCSNYIRKGMTRTEQVVSFCYHWNTYSQILHSASLVKSVLSLCIQTITPMDNLCFSGIAWPNLLFRLANSLGWQNYIQVQTPWDSDIHFPDVQWQFKSH